MFLKSSFGLGYTSTVVLTDSQVASNSRFNENSISRLKDNETTGKTKASNIKINTDDSIEKECDTEPAFFLLFQVAHRKAIRHSGREVVYRFPNGSEHQFPSIFCAFDSEMRKTLGIAGYGLSNSSLEEVFLRLAEDLPSTNAVQNPTFDESLSAENNARPDDSPPCPNRE